MLFRRWMSALLVLAVILGGCGQPEVDVRPPGEGPVTIRVPEHAPTIQQAASAAEPGDTIEVSPGTYGESVTIKTADVTLRGTDRNEVIIDGGGLRGNGIVVTAPRVTVANLTVRGFNLNGVLITGLIDANGNLAGGNDGYRRLDPEKFPPLEGFAVRYVTAANNGLYGVYAFDTQDGVIENSYLSGHAEAGISIEQCDDCAIVVRDNVAEFNAVGYQQLNASNVVSVVGNRFSDNRVGARLLSDAQEAYVPQRRALLVGNLIMDNDAEETPQQSNQLFGIGIEIAGGQDNEILRNRIEDHAEAGILLTSAEEIAPVDNQFVDNHGQNNKPDLVYTATTRAPGSGNCLRGDAFATSIGSTEPDGLGRSWACPQGGPELAGIAWQSEPEPPGISYRDVKESSDQPQQPESDRGAAPEAPAVNESDLALPPDDLWSDRARG